MQKGKVIDFLLGVVIAILLGKLILALAAFMVPKDALPAGLILLVIPVAYVTSNIFFVFYFWKRRRYISYGIGLILIIFFSLIFLELLLPSSYMVGYTIEDVIEDILF